jgi:uncharacterized RDD family membrane protein YckC
MSKPEIIEEYIESLRQLTVSHLEWMATHVDKEMFPERYKAIIDAISEKRLHPGNEESNTHKGISYAGFWVRSGALLLDGLIFLPFFFLYYHQYRFSWDAAVIIQIPYLFLWAAYNIYLLGRWGQTIGKMATHIKVTRLDGSPIGYKQAFLRHVVDLALQIITTISVLVALFSVSRVNFEISGWEARNTLLRDASPYWGVWAEHATTIWILSEMIVLLFNKKKRALHDFIAGTVVIKIKDKVV